MKGAIAAAFLVLAAISGAADLRWSDPATWGGTLPREGADVTVPEGKTVVLDVSPPRLRSLTVRGRLKFAPRDLELRAGWIFVFGGLTAGSAQTPHPARATITLLGNPGEDLSHFHHGREMRLGTKFLAVAPGALLGLYGQRRRSWTRLDGDAPAGATTVHLSEPSDWAPGDQIVLAPNDYEPLAADVRRIVAVSGATITLDRPLRWTHYGERESIAGFEVDERGEVALLSRNVVVRTAGDLDRRFGGHVMAMGACRLTLSGVELRDLGQAGRLGRYPLHLHEGWDAMRANVIGCAVNRSFQRGIVVHRTNGARIERNVVFDTPGHQFFLESATETGNRFVGNLGVLCRAVRPEFRTDPERGDIDPPTPDRPRWSSFWIANQANDFVGNVSAGVEDGFGFWFVQGTHHPERDADVFSHEGLNGSPHFEGGRYELPPGDFSGNVAHTVSRLPESDFNLGYGPVQAGSGFNLDGIAGPRRDETGRWTYRTALRGIVAYKCRNAGVWCPAAYRPTVSDAVLADNRMGSIASQGFVDQTAFARTLFLARSRNHPASRDLARLFRSFNEAFADQGALDPANGRVDEAFRLSDVRLIGY